MNAQIINTRPKFYVYSVLHLTYRQSLNAIRTNQTPLSAHLLSDFCYMIDKKKMRSERAIHMNIKLCTAMYRDVHKFKLNMLYTVTHTAPRPNQTKQKIETPMTRR